jgi:RNase P/RNase MRP subunit POP5
MKSKSRRYLAVKIVSDTSPAREKLLQNIEDSLRRLFGECGLVGASPHLVMYDPERMIAIVRCSNKWVEGLRAALALVTRCNGQQLALFVVRSAGTIRTLVEKLSALSEPKREETTSQILEASENIARNGATA